MPKTGMDSERRGDCEKKQKREKKKGVLVQKKWGSTKKVLRYGRLSGLRCGSGLTIFPQEEKKRQKKE